MYYPGGRVLKMLQSSNLCNQPAIQLRDSRLLKNCSYINGAWLTSDRSYEVFNPSNNNLIATVCEVNCEQLEYAISSANKAQKYWAEKTTIERYLLLMKWFDLIMLNRADLAYLMTIEQGKPYAESFGEIAYAASYIEWFAEQGKRVNGDIIPEPSSDRRLMSIKQPIGVVSAITPWNYPSGMITRKAAPALAAGCSFIIKPSELTPLSALALAELADQAGIPAGVFNVVTGMDASMIGDVLTTSPKIRKFTFTGSTTVGKKLLTQCASTVKSTSLELGGNAPMIIFEDADLDIAVKGAMNSKFRNSGQTCVCANRILVHRDLYDEFNRRMVAEINKLNVGDGFAESVDIGPLINTAAVKKIETLVRDASEQGAKILVGGERDQCGEHFYQPTLIVDVKPEMNIARQEIFGPVASVIPFETEEQAVAIANDTPYGLAGYFFTQDISRTWRVSEALEYGMIGVNEGILTSVQAPFGGIKESGLGREGSQYGLDDYLEIKYICMGNL